MGDPEPDKPLSSALCPQCGLCCSGVLFDWVPVAEDEEAKMRRLGLSLEEYEGGRRFAQPCPKFEQGLCGIYSDRPRSCRQFRCELLAGVERGKISLTEAERTVARAKDMIEQLRPSMESELGSPVVGKSWASLFRRWESGTPPQRTAPAQADLLLKLTVLNRFLDHHFRGKGDRRIKEE